MKCEIALTSNFHWLNFPSRLDEYGLLAPRSNIERIAVDIFFPASKCMVNLLTSLYLGIGLISRVAKLLVGLLPADFRSDTLRRSTKRTSERVILISSL